MQEIVFELNTLIAITVYRTPGLISNLQTPLRRGLLFVHARLK